MRERFVRVARGVLEVVGRDREMMDGAECGRPFVLIGKQRVEAALTIGAILEDGAAVVAALGQMPLEERRFESWRTGRSSGTDGHDF